jgi:hypothetical protein
VMFITLFASGLVSSIISEVAKIYFYRKGVWNEQMLYQ